MGLLPNLNALKPNVLLPQMLTAASSTASSRWSNIKSVATMELQTLARRIYSIGQGLANGSLDRETAKMLLKMVRNNVISAIAMFTTLVAAAAQAIVNAALAVVRTAVNTALGFVLV